MPKHWSEEKEQVRTSFPILLMLKLIQILPCWTVNMIAFPVALFYFAFSRRARIHVLHFQRQLREFTHGAVPKKISIYRTILSFSICLIERVSGWLGKAGEDSILFSDDDIEDYWNSLKAGKGAFLIGSHLGNIDLLRSLAVCSKAGLKKEIPVTAIMEIKSGERFNATLKKVNPSYELTVIDPEDIGPETIPVFQEKIQRGEIIVATGDRTSISARNRFIRNSFLGKEAEFPYGVFLIASLLQIRELYFVFGLREKTAMLNPKNRVHIHKAKTVFQDCGRTERKQKIRELCGEFAELLEKYCKEKPYQWYNFFDFWALTEYAGEK